MRRALFFLVMLAVSMVAAMPSMSHEGRPIYVEINETESGVFSMRWKIPPVLRESEIPTIDLLGEGCTGSMDGSVGSSGASFVGRRLYRCADGDRPSTIRLTYAGANPVLSTLVLFQELSGDSHSFLAPPSDRSIELPAQPDFKTVVQTYGLGGFTHILDGYDHLLFVFCLMLLVGNVGRILWAVTGFTVGHSITLGLTALSGFSLSPSFVEPLIAFSIVLLAAEKRVDRQEALAVRYPVLIASCFGLLHGFGFGGALAEIGLPYNFKLQALAFFNFGVEAGQILFIIVVLMLAKTGQVVMKAATATPSYDIPLKLAVNFAGLIAGYWTIERVVSVWA